MAHQHRPTAALLASAVFGAFDGANSIIGLLNGVPATHVFSAAWHVAVSAGMSMGAGEWLSGRSASRGRSALAIGTATAAGTVWPAVPFAMLRGWEALVSTGASLVVLGAVISLVCARIAVEDGAAAKSLGRASFETFTAMAVVCAAVAVAGG